MIRFGQTQFSVNKSHARHKFKAVALIEIDRVTKGWDLRELIRIIKFEILRPM
jgi:hypothetical protein